MSNFFAIANKYSFDYVLLWASYFKYLNHSKVVCAHLVNMAQNLVKFIQTKSYTSSKPAPFTTSPITYPSLFSST